MRPPFACIVAMDMMRLVEAGGLELGRDVGGRPG
jgi:hypothetical protein